MAGPEKLGKNARQEFEFPRGTDNLVVDVTSGIYLVLDLFKEEGMLTDLTELHQLIGKPRECIPLAINAAGSECQKG